MTRRSFNKLAGPLLASATGARGAAAKLRLGIGTFSYHSLSLDDMIVQLRRLEIQEIEMSRGEFMLFSRPNPEQFESARSKFDRAGIRCVSYYAATIHNEQELEDAVRFAKLLGAGNITADATGATLLKHIDNSCQAASLTCGIHNHFFKGRKFPYESPAEVLAVLEGLSPAMGATADTGQFASCGHDPAAAIRRLAPRLKMVHLKDIQAPGDEVNVLLGKGIARIPEVLQELQKMNFRGLVAIEYEKEGPVEEDLGIEVDWVRRRL